MCHRTLHAVSTKKFKNLDKREFSGNVWMFKWTEEGFKNSLDIHERN